MHTGWHGKSRIRAVANAAAPYRRCMWTFDTERVPVRERFDYWTDAVAQTFVHVQMRPPADPRSFGAVARSQQAGSVRLCRFQSTALDAARTFAQVRADGVDACSVTLQLRGIAQIRQYGRATVLWPGDLTVIDTRSPYTISFRGHPTDHLAVYMSRDLAARAGLDPSTLAARRISATAVGAPFIGHYLAAAEAAVAGLTDTRRVELGQDCVDRLVLALRQEFPDAVPPRREAGLQEVTAYLEMNLSDPLLTPYRAATAHGISVRQLHRLFAGSGTTFAAWIREQRLSRCRRDLTDPGMRGWPIAAIGARWGLTNPTVFSRMFRHRYGASPCETRRHALSARSPR